MGGATALVLAAVLSATAVIGVSGAFATAGLVGWYPFQESAPSPLPYAYDRASGSSAFGAIPMTGDAVGPNGFAWKPDGSGMRTANLRRSNGTAAGFISRLDRSEPGRTGAEFTISVWVQFDEPIGPADVPRPIVGAGDWTADDTVIDPNRGDWLLRTIAGGYLELSYRVAANDVRRVSTFNAIRNIGRPSLITIRCVYIVPIDSYYILWNVDGATDSGWSGPNYDLSSWSTAHRLTFFAGATATPASDPTATHWPGSVLAFALHNRSLSTPEVTANIASGPPLSAPYVLPRAHACFADSGPGVPASTISFAAGGCNTTIQAFDQESINQSPAATPVDVFVVSLPAVSGAKLYRYNASSDVWLEISSVPALIGSCTGKKVNDTASPYPPIRIGYRPPLHQFSQPLSTSTFDSIQLSASDGSLISQTVAFTISVRPIDHAPVAINASATCTAGIPCLMRGLSYDIDSALPQTPDTAAFIGNSLTITAVPSYGAVYQYSGTVVLSSGPIGSGGGLPITKPDMSLASLITGSAVAAVLDGSGVPVLNAGGWVVFVGAFPPTADGSGQSIVYSDAVGFGVRDNYLFAAATGAIQITAFNPLIALTGSSTVPGDALTPIHVRGTASAVSGSVGFQITALPSRGVLVLAAALNATRNEWTPAAGAVPLQLDDLPVSFQVVGGGVATAANATVWYRPPPFEFGSGFDSFAFRMTDSTHFPLFAGVSTLQYITVTAVNHRPTLDCPYQVMAHLPSFDVITPPSTLNCSLSDIRDQHSPSASAYTASVSVASGTISFARALFDDTAFMGRVSFAFGIGSSEQHMVFTGAYADVQLILLTLTYTFGAASETGTDVYTVSVSDGSTLPPSPYTAYAAVRIVQVNDRANEPADGATRDGSYIDWIVRNPAILYTAIGIVAMCFLACGYRYVRNSCRNRQQLATASAPAATPVNTTATGTDAANTNGAAAAAATPVAANTTSIDTAALVTTITTAVIAAQNQTKKGKKKKTAKRTAAAARTTGTFAVDRSMPGWDQKTATGSVAIEMADARHMVHACLADGSRPPPPASPPPPNTRGIAASPNALPRTAAVLTTEGSGEPDYDAASLRERAHTPPLARAEDSGGVTPSPGNTPTKPLRPFNGGEVGSSSSPDRSGNNSVTASPAKAVRAGGYQPFARSALGKGEVLFAATAIAIPTVEQPNAGDSLSPLPRPATGRMLSFNPSATATAIDAAPTDSTDTGAGGAGGSGDGGAVVAVVSILQHDIMRDAGAGLAAASVPPRLDAPPAVTPVATATDEVPEDELEVAAAHFQADREDLDSAAAEYLASRNADIEPALEAAPAPAGIASRDVVIDISGRNSPIVAASAAATVASSAPPADDMPT